MKFQQVVRLSPLGGDGENVTFSGGMADHDGKLGDIWGGDSVDVFLDYVSTGQVGLSDIPLTFPSGTRPPSPTPASKTSVEATSPMLPTTPSFDANLAFIPATPPPIVAPNPPGLTSCDWEEAVRQKVPVSELKFFEAGSKRKRTRRGLGFRERDSRPLGIVGWSALTQFQKVPATPLHLWIKTDRYPELMVAGIKDPPIFTSATPKLKALLPVRLPEALPHSLTYMECGFSPPGEPLNRCRILLPTLSDWEAHQYVTHALGFLCPSCRVWLSSEEALKAHSLECFQLRA